MNTKFCHSYMYHHLPFLYLEVKNKQTMDANVCVTKLFVEVKFSFILFSINEMNVPKNSSANFKETGCNVHVQCLTMFSLFPRQSWPARCQNNMNAKKPGISNLPVWKLGSSKETNNWRRGHVSYFPSHSHSHSAFAMLPCSFGQN